MKYRITSYFILRRFVKFLMWVFFNEIMVRNTEAIPTQGPVLFAINHPNNLMDTLVAGAVIDRKIHFLATGQLFKNRWLEGILKGLGVIPVYRKEDLPGQGRERNVASFEACYQILEEGGTIGIYPEGITHCERQVKKIRTGAARIVLEAEARNQFRLGVVVVPVGLNFTSRQLFRSNVLVNIGKPISVADYLSAYKKDPVATVQSLTDEIWRRIVALVVHVDKVDLNQLVMDIEKLYKGDLIRYLAMAKGLRREEVDEIRLSKKIVDCVVYYDSKHPRIVRNIWREIHHYQRKLRKMHVQDEMIRKELKEGLLVGTYLKVAIKGLIGMPLFLYGLINNYLPHRVPRHVARKFSKKPTDMAMIKLGVGIFSFPLFYSLQTYACWKLFGTKIALGYLISLPFSGFFALRFGKKLNRYAQNIYFSYLYLTHRGLLYKIKEERKRLIKKIERLKDRYLRTLKQERT